MPRVTMPQLGESVAEGTIGRWLKKPGDHIDKYEAIVEVVTDKVNAEVPSPFAGTLTEILVAEGVTVPNGAEIAIIEEAAAAGATASTDKAGPVVALPGGTPIAPVGIPVAGTPAPQAPAAGVSGNGRGTVAAVGGVPVATAGLTATPDEAIAGYEGRMTPAVRRLARENSVNLARIAGSGHGGRVTREDVLAYIERRGHEAAGGAAVESSRAVPAEPAAIPAAEPGAGLAAVGPGRAPDSARPEDHLKPLSKMRRGIAGQMTRSLAAPQAYLTLEVDMSGVVGLRERMKAEYLAREGIGLSYVPFVTKAAVEGLRRHPDLNAHWTDEGLLVRGRINVGIAVAVEDGLLVPVVHDADLLSVNGLNHAISDLASRARASRLRLEDIQGGTFTVDNTGWFGSIVSGPIVNVPEIVIVTMEAIVKRPVVIESPLGDALGIRPMMNLCTSFDHRATDGAQVGRFMQDMKQWLESVDAQTSIW